MANIPIKWGKVGTDGKAEVNGADNTTFSSSSPAFKVNGDEEITGDSSVGGGQSITGNSSVGGNLSVSGADGITAEKLNGQTIGSTPKFTDTTYTAGTGLSLSNGAFSVNTGYTTSGNKRKVETDSDGNLYVEQKDDNTTYTAGAGLVLSGTTFKTNVPRVTENARTLPGNNTITFKEYNSSSSNLPSSAWYYIFSMQGGDANYGAQLALGMTTTACYYQVKNANTWSGWKSLINTDTDNKVTQNASTSNNNGYELILSGTADNTTRTEGVLKSSRFKSNPSNGQTYWYDASRARIYGEPNTGKFEGYNNSGGMNWSLRGDTGQIVCVYVTQGSSRKIKDNIKPIEDSEKVLQLQAVSFDYKDKNRGTNKRGFIAEDVAEILPNVTTPESLDTPMGINYTELIPYLQDVVKKQEARITLLEEQIQTLLNEKEENK